MPEYANADQALIHRFLAAPQQPLPIDSNPMAIALGMQLLHVDAAAGVVELAFQGHFARFAEIAQ